MKATLKFGLLTPMVLMIVGLLGSLLSSISWIFTILGIAAFIGCIAYGMKERRDNELEGAMRYGQGLGAGMMIALMTALILGVFTAIGTTTWAEEEIGKAKEQAMTELEAQYDAGQMQEEAYDWMVDFYSNTVFTPWFMGTATVFGYIFFGFIISLIVAAFMKKDPPFQAESSLSDEFG